MTTEPNLRKLIAEHFRSASIEIDNIEIRSFPGETIAIIDVARDYERALTLAQELDAQIEGGFVTVRRTAQGKGNSIVKHRVKSVHDSRILELIELMSARSRTSESQPSLKYVSDVEERINLAVAARHHLIFGRRGVGKTALLLEAKRILEKRGAYVLWVNMQPLRDLTKEEAFLTIGSRLCDLCISHLQGRPVKGGLNLMVTIREAIEQQLYKFEPKSKDVAALVPKLQQALSRFCIESDQSVYIFLDDIHYIEMQLVPGLLDLLHGISRDNPVWLKIAGIQHQTRWFTPNPPVGLQTGHDAAIINLDVTLEQPEKAKHFLEDVLTGYVENCNALPVSAFLGAAAIDRLVLASGGVPRDFLTLCAASLQIARQRTNARTVGVQDVNNAAGAAAKTKLQELEDDAAAALGRSQALVATLNGLREFLLNKHQITFLRVDFRDKEIRKEEYALMIALCDLRMLHLISASLSDAHHAGSRSEVYLLDLSQYSGSRLKQKLRVLDFVHGHMVLKKTGSKDVPRVGDSPRKLVELLRRGPIYDLSELKDIINQEQAT